MGGTQQNDYFIIFIYDFMSESGEGDSHTGNI